MQMWLVFILTLIPFAALHEGTQALLATAYGEYKAFFMLVSTASNYPIKPRFMNAMDGYSRHGYKYDLEHWSLAL
jgi:hypothetical protein